MVVGLTLAQDQSNMVAQLMAENCKEKQNEH
jgi:hypothetical protein